MIPKEVLSRLAEQGIPCRTEQSLRELCTFRIGGVAELVIRPETTDQLVAAVRLLRNAEIRFAVVGRGSNLLFGDGLLQTALILTGGLCGLTVTEQTVFAEAGVSLANLAVAAAQAGLSGLEFAAGIPGSVGGAMFMNAGAYGRAMSDVTVCSRALDTETGELLTIPLAEHGFGYRASIYQKEPHLICLGAELLLTEGNTAEIRAQMRHLARQRREKQPLEYPSAGSYFKRPEGQFAGKLIEDCGLKGVSVGGAAVSEKHAGFIINTGDATAADVLALEAQVHRAVEERFGVVLEREVCFLAT